LTTRKTGSLLRLTGGTNQENNIQGFRPNNMLQQTGHANDGSS
jgi:hypothetical protein